ncbi:UDP-glucose:undecaprenyl-phosphate glucose-1-phosphate transferase [Agromyces sp. NDB4Y10]|uniref:sugar transferase n=1 Tax=Agromyces sp. NDB4Y10 TaxID=1775951 RepID=UPI0007B2077C|nr:sugar transferase [Agromyces sp. NDB4Y10]KZE92850.1 UDP-glucose:undecaprenyl-phosphate glucose-1-phosphate transferase [Agromyces sp. NDB4Y10]
MVSAIASTYLMTRVPTSQWSIRLARRVAITDLLVLSWVVFGVQIAWLGLDSSAMGFSGSRGDIAVSYTLVSVVIILGWMVALELFDTREHRNLGVGTQEYRGVADATIRWFGIVAIVAFLFKVDLARGYILIAFPLGLMVLVFSRWMWRQWLGVQRRAGRFVSRVLLVGSTSSAITIARELKRNPEAGYRVMGACVPTGVTGGRLPDLEVPAWSGTTNALAVMRDLGADTVVITSADELGPDQVKQLSWGLNPGAEHLVVAPSLIDIGGPRIHTRPVAGLPLIHVETPKFEGRKLVAKRAFDLLVAGGLVLLLSPLLVAIAAIVKFSSPGPVLFRQRRVGINGRPFEMLKFRSMVIDAEARLAELQAAQRDAGNAVMFKMKDDPRVTPIGRFIRRFSLDELPQLFNVLGGSMSLVGPRPPLPRETDVYDSHVHRRFLVKPGITGLWQVSGRSNLSWEDTVRLDLYYVENWSMTGDLVILWRTAKAVLGSDGAY